MLTVELINRAYVLSGIVSRDLDAVEGSEGADGRFWLNQLLKSQGIQGSLIPYQRYISFNTVVGQEKYFVEDLVRIDAITFNLQTVRYEMIEDNRQHYFGAPRVDNIQALPFHYYWERVDGGSDIYLYFLPQEVMPIKIKGIFQLDEVTNDTELNDTYDTFYQYYLMYELAYQLCDWFKLSLAPQTMDTLKSLRKRLTDLNPMDLTIKKISTLSNEATITYAQANLGKGWTAP